MVSSFFTNNTNNTPGPNERNDEKKFKNEKKSLSFQNFQNFQKIRHFGKKTVQIHTNDSIPTRKNKEESTMEENTEANGTVSAPDDDAAALPDQRREPEVRAEKEEEEKPTAPVVAPTIIPETTKPSSTTTTTITTTTTTKKSIAKELASHNSAKEPELKTGKRERKKTEFLSATLLQSPSKKGEERKKEQVGKGVKLREIENVKFAMDKMKRYVRK